MISRKHWIRASTLIGGVLAATAALAQTPPATSPRETTGDQSATEQTAPSKSSTTGDESAALDPTPGPASTTDQENSSTSRDQSKTDAAGNRTRVSQKDPHTKDPNRETRQPPAPADEEDEEDEDTTSTQPTPPPDTESDADTQSDTADPPQQR